MFCLESAIASDSFVRVVDAFVDAIDLKSFGFAHVECQEEGRPPYHPSILLKLYLYGYRYGIRTSRKLEREARTNMEAMWLLSGLRPKYKTIADFRKNHSKAFREVFRRFVCLLKDWELIEGETHVYVCPQGQEMTTNHTWHRHSDKRKGKTGAYRFKRFNTTACKTCTSRHLCSQSKNGRYIDRSEYAEVVEENAKRVHQNPDYYRKRQQITEHMFGTLKRQRGFTFTLVRGKENVLGEVGLMFIGYNLSRCVSVLGVEKLIKALRKCCLPYFSELFKLILSPLRYFLEKLIFSLFDSRTDFMLPELTN